MNKGIEEFADEQSTAKFLENQEIARKNRVLNTELKAVRTQLTEAQLEVAAKQVELDLFGYHFADAPKWLTTPKNTKKNVGTLVSVLSDTHYGEVVVAAEMDGYNEYNIAIAEQRTKKFFTRTVMLAHNFLAGVEFDGIVLALNGDLVSGDIHEELVETNELSTYETILWTVPKLVAGIRVFKEAFGKVHIVAAPGNHGRNSKLPRYKKRSANNADTLIARLVAREFEGVEGVTFHIPETTDADFRIYNSKFTMEHGDDLKFNGTAEIGSIGPMKRGTLRKMTQKTTEGKPFDYFIISHFHQYIPADTQGFIANGSLKGYDEYARGNKFKPEKAKQALFVVTPEYGITTQMPVFVEDRKSEKW